MQARGFAVGVIRPVGQKLFFEISFNDLAFEKLLDCSA
jgi:hypothetical protein